MSTKRNNSYELTSTLKKKKKNHEFNTSIISNNKCLNEIIYELHNKIHLIEYKINQIEILLNSINNPNPINNYQSSYII